jgi:hypothetical protein
MYIPADANRSQGAQTVESQLVPALPFKYQPFEVTLAAR